MNKYIYSYIWNVQKIRDKMIGLRFSANKFFLKLKKPLSWRKIRVSLTVVFARPNFGYLVDKSYLCTMRCLCESVVFSIYDREIATKLSCLQELRTREVAWQTSRGTQGRVMSKLQIYILCRTRRKSDSSKTLLTHSKYTDGKSLENGSHWIYCDMNFIINKIVLYRLNIVIIIFAYISFVNHNNHKLNTRIWKYDICL